MTTVEDMETQTGRAPGRAGRVLATLVEVLRRPLEFGLTGVAIVLVLFLANRADLLPRVLKGAGIEVEFPEKIVQAVANTEGGVEDLNRKVAALSDELKQLRALVEKGPVIGPPPPALAASQAPMSPAAQRAGTPGTEDVAAAQSALIDASETVQGPGFIWLGTYDTEAQRWLETSVLAPDGAPPGRPETLDGKDLRLATDVNIRESFPQDNDSYFRAVRALGVSPQGTRVTVTTRPKLYYRGTGVQVWAGIDVSYRPYIGTR